MTFGDYILAVMHQWSETPSWRAGQTYFNVLYRMRPEMADSLRGSSRDPFYNDDRIDDFLDYVLRHWK